MVHTPTRRAGAHVSQPTGFGSIANSTRGHNKAHPRQEEDGEDGSTTPAGGAAVSETPPTQTSINSNANPVPALTGDWKDVFDHTWNTGGNATTISRQSEVVLRYCPNESLQRNGLSSEVLLLGDKSATANLALNTYENFTIHLGMSILNPYRITFGVTTVDDLTGEEYTTTLSSIIVPADLSAITSSANVQCGSTLTRDNLRVPDNIKVEYVRITTVHENILFIFNATLPTDQVVLNSSVAESGSLSNKGVRMAVLVGVPLAVVSLVAAAGIWAFYRFRSQKRRSRRATMAYTKMDESGEARSATAVDNTLNLVSISPKDKAKSKSTGDQKTEDPFVDAPRRSTTSGADGSTYEASEFLRASSHEPSETGHTFDSVSRSSGTYVGGSAPSEIFKGSIGESVTVRSVVTRSSAASSRASRYPFLDGRRASTQSASPFSDVETNSYSSHASWSTVGRGGR